MFVGEFDSDENEYRLVAAASFGPYPFKRYSATEPVCAFIPEYGVIMWATAKSTMLYKHDSSIKYPLAAAAPQAEEPEKKKEEKTNTCRTIENLKKGKKQTIICFGTSLTSHGRWVKMLSDALENEFPGQAKVINSGGSGKTSKWGLEVLGHKVILKKPDLVLIEFCVNDSNIGNNIPVEQSNRNLETMISRIKSARPSCEIIPMTMTAPIKKNKPDLDAYYDGYKAVAKKYNLKLIDINKHWKQLQKEDPAKYKKYVPDGVHAKEEGCKKMIMPVLLWELMGIKVAPDSVKATGQTAEKMRKLQDTKKGKK